MRPPISCRCGGGGDGGGGGGGDGRSGGWLMSQRLLHAVSAMPLRRGSRIRGGHAHAAAMEPLVALRGEGG